MELKMILEGLLIALAFVALWREEIIRGIHIVANTIKAIAPKRVNNVVREERA